MQVFLNADFHNRKTRVLGVSGVNKSRTKEERGWKISTDKALYYSEHFFADDRNQLKVAKA